MTQTYLKIILSLLITAEAVQALPPESASIRERVQAEVNKLIELIPATTIQEIRKNPTTLFNGPVFMDVTNTVSIDKIPEWGIHSKELVASLVSSMATSQIRGEPFDLLGFLQLGVVPIARNSNIPVNVDTLSLPKGFALTHILYQVSIEGNIAALYVATEVKRGDYVVRRIGGQSWRAPTSDEIHLIKLKACEIGIYPR